MSILKWQVNLSSNFTSFFIVMTYNSSINFKLIHFLLWTKGSHQGPNFDTFKCSRENLPNFSYHSLNHKSVFLRILTAKYDSSVLFYLIKYILCSKEPIKLKTFATIDCSGQSLSNSSYQFWNDKLIPYQVLYHSLVSWKITTMYFFSSNNIYFAQKERMKVNIFETFKWSSQN